MKEAARNLNLPWEVLNETLSTSYTCWLPGVQIGAIPARLNGALGSSWCGCSYTNKAALSSG